MALALVLMAVVAAAACLGVIIWRIRKSTKMSEGLPPGPLSVPFFGNVNTSKRERLHESFSAWSKTHGSVITVSIGDRKTVVLNGYDAIKEALIDNADDYSGRPAWAATETYTTNRLGPNQDMQDVKLGPAWNDRDSCCDKILRSLDNGRSTDQRISDEASYVMDYFYSRGTEATDPRVVLECCIANIMSSLIYGTRYDEDDTEFTQMVLALSDIKTYWPSIMMMELRPVSKLSKEHKQAKELFMKSWETLNNFQEDRVLERIRRLEDDDDIAPHDFVEHYLQLLNKDDCNLDSKIQEAILKVVCNELLLSSVTAVSATLSWALLRMATSSAVQNKVHKELDKSFGRQPREFVYAEQTQLPYLSAVLMEVQRTASVVPYSVHSTTSDINFREFKFTKNTTVFINNDSVLKDNDIWPEQIEFRPDRFLDDAGKSWNAEEWIVFSIGKRACPGEDLARRQLFIIFATIMQSFEVQLPEGSSEPNMRGVDEGVIKPPPYDIILKPRF